MTSILDSDISLFLVIENDEKQQSLWPSTLLVPKGWTTIHGPTNRENCLTYVNEAWTDMRPKCVRDHLIENS